MSAPLVETTDGRHRRTLPAAPAPVESRSTGWAAWMAPPGPESRRSKITSRLGGAVALGALALYLTYRVAFTLPTHGSGVYVAWALVALEAMPVFGLLAQVTALWSIDGHAPRRITPGAPAPTVAVMIPTYDEPMDVLAPTIAAACALEPAHATWVLDDGDRPWVQDLCRAYGARYVQRETHEHAKAGNINHALEVMQHEAEAGATDYEVLAFLDCDHVPLPGFLTETLGWFDDPDVALVQAPQSYYNDGAFDDDGSSGEQGLFFHVQMPAKNSANSGAFWCGSTSLIRREALHNIGGIATDTIVEDMHTTLLLMRLGWRSVYHHQTLALGLAPDTSSSYLLQRRRWALGAMQVLVTEGLFRAKRGLSWRTYREYLEATVWWLEGVATVFALLLPAALMLAGSNTSVAPVWQFATVFVLTFTLRLWGIKALFRGHIEWLSAFSLRIIRIPIGLACVWWLITRRTLRFEVTPKSAAAKRSVGKVPASITLLLVVTNVLLVYAAAGVADLVPWQATARSTAVSAAWLVFGDLALVLGAFRIRHPRYASSRRKSHRFDLELPVAVGDEHGMLTDVSVGGLAVRFDSGAVPDGKVEIGLPGSDILIARFVGVRRRGTSAVASYRIDPADYASLRTMSLWLFHTPHVVFPGLTPGVPVIAAA